jgi:hypothetical protein
MPALFLNLLKLLFLALLFIFLWQVARSIRSHLGPAPAGRSTAAGREMVVVRSESMAGRRYPLGKPQVIGRSAEADIVVDDGYASEFHFRIGIQDGEVVVHDLGSTNGTYVNGRRVTAPTGLGRGDSVQIGKTIFEVR